MLRGRGRRAGLAFEGFEEGFEFGVAGGAGGEPTAVVVAAGEQGKGFRGGGGGVEEAAAGEWDDVVVRAVAEEFGRAGKVG